MPMDYIPNVLYITIYIILNILPYLNMSNIHWWKYRTNVLLLRSCKVVSNNRLRIYIYWERERFQFSNSKKMQLKNWNKAPSNICNEKFAHLKILCSKNDFCHFRYWRWSLEMVMVLILCVKWCCTVLHIKFHENVFLLKGGMLANIILFLK